MSRLPIRREHDVEPVGLADRSEGHLLLGTLLIGGIPHHVEAFEVEDEDRDDCQESRRPERETHCAELSEIAQGAMRTVTIAGRPYVLLVTPFQE